MDKKYKYLAVLLYSISLLTGTIIDLEDEGFKELMMGFFSNFYYAEKKILDKIFEFRVEKMGKINILIDYDKLEKYGNYFLTNPKKLSDLYNEIGYEDINEISRLAELFCYYCLEVDSMNKNIKRH